MSNFIFVDVEAAGSSPVNGTMTEFGCVAENTGETYHGILFASHPDPENPAKPVVGERLKTDEEVAKELVWWLKTVNKKERPVFVSDNPAYDFMWIAGMFDKAGIENPFGWSGRRLSDFWAGLQNNWGETMGWKDFRMTPHDHNPVNDAIGNVEAFQELKRIAKEQRNANKI